MFSNKDIEQYYDVSATHYNKVWNLKKSRSLHYGYWDATTKHFHDAMMNINKILSTKASITNTHHVLDAGCGIGGSALWLAKNIGCKVTGISLSAKQVATANQLALYEQVQHIAHFEQQDFTNTTFADASFDIIWAIESVCHAPQKAAFISEAYRLLKPGGKLIIADFFKKDQLALKDAQLIKRWAEGWAIDDFDTKENFHETLIQKGFHNIDVADATTNIKPSAKRLYWAYFPGVIGGWLYRITHKKVTTFGKKNIDTAYLQYTSLQKHLWTYQIFCATKQ